MNFTNRTRLLFWYDKAIYYTWTGGRRPVVEDRGRRTGRRAMFCRHRVLPSRRRPHAVVAPFLPPRRLPQTTGSETTSEKHCWHRSSVLRWLITSVAHIYGRREYEAHGENINYISRGGEGNTWDVGGPGGPAALRPLTAASIIALLIHLGHCPTRWRQTNK